MNPTKTLPETYTLAWTVDTKIDTRLNWLLQIAGAFLFLMVGWGLWQTISVLRPDFVVGARITISIGLLLYALLVIFITLLLHELIHGLFFWIFTRERPVFGMGPGYAYAAAPDWYFPKGLYLMVGLAPLVAITVLGLVLLLVIPAGWIGVVFLAIVFNAGGAVADLYVCLRIGGEPRQILIRDSGDTFEIYRQGV